MRGSGVGYEQTAGLESTRARASPTHGGPVASAGDAMAGLVELDPPAQDADATAPILPIAEHEDRLRATVARMRAARLDALVVYGDREHSANLAFLTGVEPRFEEALLVLDARGGRALLVGNECLGYAPDPALGIAIALFQDFSLLGQP